MPSTFRPNESFHLPHLQPLFVWLGLFWEQILVQQQSPSNLIYHPDDHDFTKSVLNETF